MSKRSTTEEFILKAKAIHGDKYDYSEAEYTGNHDKIIIVCKIHGEFETTPSNHLSGHDCPKCSCREKYSLETFIDKSIIIHNNKYDYSKVKYESGNKKVLIICPEHGEFLQTPYAHLKGQKCPECAKLITAEKRKITKDDFVKRASKIHNGKYDYTNSIITSGRELTEIICPIHGKFKQIVSNHLSGAGCYLCRRILTTPEFIFKARQLHGNKYNYEKVKYNSTWEKVCIVCPEHGEFWQKPHLHLTGCGCPKCKLKKQTLLYDKLKESLSNCNIIFEASKKDIPWIETQRIDIYFPDYNIAIEYDGELHFSPIEHFGGKARFEQQQTWDLIKQQKCSENHCALFRIKYNYSEEDYNKLVNNIKEIIKC